MASPGCCKLPLLSRIAPNRPRTLHPHHATLLPSPHPDLLPCTHSTHSLSSPSPPNAAPSLVRNVFEDAAVCSSLPGFVDSRSSTSTKDELARTESSEISSFSSSSDFCMSSNSDNDEDDTSSSSACSSTMFESPPVQEGPLDSLGSLCAALPIKRGLSRHFTGKSQSFSSLARVLSVAELAKPENPYNKRRRMACMATELSTLKHHSYPPRCSSNSGIAKRLPTCSKYKSFKTIPCLEGVSLEGLAKCFSVPEF